MGRTLDWWVVLATSPNLSKGCVFTFLAAVDVSITVEELRGSALRGQELG